MKTQNKIIVLLLVCVLLSPLPAKPPSEKQKTTSVPGIILLDLFVPGAGAVYYKNYIAAPLIIVGRLLSAYAAYDFWRESARYRSAEKAARNADLYFGYGYRYKDPYSGAYHSADEFQRLADRRSLGLSLSASVFLAVTIISAVYTGKRALAEERKILPVFEIKPEAHAKGTKYAFGFRLLK